MAADFESRCSDISVEVQQSPALPLFTRFQQEQAAGVDTADVLSVAGYGLYEQAKATDLIAPIDPSVLEGYPAAYADPDGYWFSSRVVTMMIVINTNVIAAGDEPTGWKDLLDPKYAGNIALTDPVQNGTGYILLWQLLHTDGLGQDYLNSLAEQHPVLVSTTGQTVTSLVSGEFGVAMIPDDNAWVQIATGAPLKVIVPSEGVGTNPNYNMLPKTAPHKEAATVFLKYLASKEGGEASANSVNDYTAWPNIIPPPAGREALGELPTLTSDGAQQAAEQGDKAIEFFDLFSGS